MVKNTTTYECSNCGKTVTRWFGKCPKCNEWGSLVEVTVAKGAVATTQQAGLKSAEAQAPVKRALTVSQLSKNPIVRTPTGIGELDRVLGGGFVDAEVVLFAGQPGAGKSTLSLSIANAFAEMGKTVLYSSGEESEQQIGLRAKRMSVDNENIKITNETNLETLLGHLEEEKPDFLIVDSLQTLASTQISGSIGSIAQSKEAAHTLTRYAKNNNVSMVLINQIVKSGEFAGSEAIQHIVDAAIILDSDSDTPLKFLRATKNRFGDTNEVGVFQHSEYGLEEVSDPGGIFLDVDDSEAQEGASCSFISEGVRQIPVEIQALATTSSLANPRKQFNGVNFQRAQIVCAILDKHCKTKTFDNDVFVSTVSGIKVNDPLADLSIAASLISSLKSIEITKGIAFVGELSLTGHVRGTFMVENKIREAERLGFEKIIVPYTAFKGLAKKKRKIQVLAISNVKELPNFLK